MTNTRSIRFSADEILAHQAGRKSQFRRRLNPQPGSHLHYLPGVCLDLDRPFSWSSLPPDEIGSEWMDESFSCRCPFGAPGDRLWVKETFQIESNQGYQDAYGAPDNPRGPVRWHEEEGPDSCGETYFECPRYRADEPDTLLCIASDDEDGMRWRPSTHLPRWASRYTLEIVSRSVQRVCEISEEDAIAEGCRAGGATGYTGLVEMDADWDARDQFRILWIARHGEDSWLRDWVWVVGYREVDHE